MPKKIVCLLVSTLLIGGCSKSGEDVREAVFREHFDQAVDDHDYCKAVQVARDRFNYRTNLGEPIPEKEFKYLEQWNKRAKPAEVECSKQQWIAQKQQYKQQIAALQQLLTKLEQLQQQFTITWHQDDVIYNEETGYKYTPLRINNQTGYRVTGFQLDYRPFNGEYGRQGFNYPGDLGVMGYDLKLHSDSPVFEPGTDSSFDIRVVDTPNLESLPDRVVIPLLSISTVENGEPKAYEFKQIDQIKRDIASIQHRLNTEDPNNSNSSND